MVTDNNISWKIVTKENINIATEQLVDIDPASQSYSIPTLSWYSGASLIKDALAVTGSTKR